MTGTIKNMGTIPKIYLHSLVYLKWNTYIYLYTKNKMKKLTEELFDNAQHYIDDLVLITEQLEKDFNEEFSDMFHALYIYEGFLKELKERKK